MANTFTPNFNIPKPAAGDINWEDEYATLVDLIDSRLMITGHKNAVVNGNFNINQLGVSGTVVLAAGAFGHDRWKAGSSGCTYTFATVANVTTITITAGSLIQIVAGTNLFSGGYVLSWSGTAQGKIDGGAFSATGVAGTATGGTNMTLEFNTGTISKVQLETGNTPTNFELRPIGLEFIFPLPGSVVQVVHVQDGAIATGTTTIPFDNTIPQNTEGNEFMTLAITPKNASNKLKIDVVMNLANGGSGILNIVSALFQGSSVNALAVVMQSKGANEGVVNRFTHWMTAGTTLAITFKVRSGCDKAGTTTFNGNAGLAKYGSAFASSITITEIQV